MTNFTNEQLDALLKDATPGPWVAKGRYIGTPSHMSYVAEVRDQNGNWSDTAKSRCDAALIAAAPDLARLVLEKDKEIARLKGLAWIAFHEFNTINARSGGPLDQYGMVTVTHEYWQAITDLFAKAAEETTPWPTENAKAIFEEINRQAMKETSDDK